MFAIVKVALSAQQLQERGAVRCRKAYTMTREMYYVYEGSVTGSDPAPGLLVLSDYGVNEGPYFEYPADCLELED